MEDDCRRVVVRAVNAETGDGLFLRPDVGERDDGAAEAGVPAGERVLYETPFVFAQSYGTSALGCQYGSATPSESARAPQSPSDTTILTLRCCFGCGASMVPSLQDELRRVLAIHARRASSDSAPLSSPRWEEDLDAPASPPASQTPLEWRLCHHEDGSARCVRFCSPACERHALSVDGKRFVLSPCTMSVASTVLIGAIREWRYPTLRHIWRHGGPGASTAPALEMTSSVAARRRCWSTPQEALDTLHHIARHYNERLWLIVLCLAKLLSRTLEEAPRLASAGSGSTGQLGGWRAAGRIASFAASVESFLAAYADGAARVLCAEQRAFLRYTWHVVTWWLYVALTHADDDDGDDSVFQHLQGEGLPLQRLLQLHWLMDANVHAYVVVSPLFSWWCHPASSHDAVEEGGTEGVRADESVGVVQRTRDKLANNLGELFRDTARRQPEAATQLSGVLSPEVVAPHATGVALYKIATKINHSCDPSVRFVPNHGPVGADVVALKPLRPGEELFTSYINLIPCARSRRSEEEAASVRRERLLQGYGFVCQCPRCAVLDGLATGPASVRRSK